MLLMFNRPRPRQGFTMLELVIVVVLLGVLVRYAIGKWTDPALLNMPQQAETAADLVRQAQSLAMSRGQRMGIEVVPSNTTAVPPVPGNFKLVACTGAGLGTCSTVGTLDVLAGVQLPAASALYFNSQGLPLQASGTSLVPLAGERSFALEFTESNALDPHVYTVRVAALTGHVTITEAHP